MAGTRASLRQQIGRAGARARCRGHLCSSPRQPAGRVPGAPPEHWRGRGLSSTHLIRGVICTSPLLEIPITPSGYHLLWPRTARCHLATRRWTATSSAGPLDSSGTPPGPSAPATSDLRAGNVQDRRRYRHRHRQSQASADAHVFPVPSTSTRGTFHVLSYLATPTAPTS